MYLKNSIATQGYDCSVLALAFFKIRPHFLAFHLNFGLAITTIKAS